MMTKYIQGIDVSKHQGAVDWNAVKNAGMRFGIIKATEGVGYTDPRFFENWTKLRELDGEIYRGVYAFTRPDSIGGEKDGMNEAAHLCTTLARAGGINNMLPPAIDYEKYTDFDAKTDQAFMRGFVRTVEDRLGRSPMIYTGRNVWRYQLANSAEWAHLPLWLVRYTTAALGAKAHGELPWKAWTLWQWSGGGDFAFHGPVPGVKGACDVNRFAGTEVDLAALAGAQRPVEPALEHVDAMLAFHRSEVTRLEGVRAELVG